jgi:endoglucanase
MALLAAAVRAYRAAEANPALHAPYTDGSFGGGDYSG